jgi:hypothetical protein
LSAPGKGIDDIREFLGDGFLDFWRDIVEEAVGVSSKANPSALALKLLIPELPTIKSSSHRDDYESQIITLAGKLESVPLSKLASAVKEHLGIPVTALKANATQRDYEDAGEMPMPDFYCDGTSYFRPYQGGFERLSREDAALDLRKMGFRHRLSAGCELLVNLPCTGCKRSIASILQDHFVADRQDSGRKGQPEFFALAGQ